MYKLYTYKIYAQICTCTQLIRVLLFLQHKQVDFIDSVQKSAANFIIVYQIAAKFNFFINNKRRMYRQHSRNRKYKVSNGFKNDIQESINILLDYISQKYSQNNVNFYVKHLAYPILLDVLPSGIPQQKESQNYDLPTNETTPRLTGFFHQIQKKKMFEITQRQQERVKKSLINLLQHKVMSYQDIADLAKDKARNKNFLPSIVWSKRFLDKNLQLKQKVFEVKSDFLDFKESMKRRRPYHTNQPNPYKRNQKKLSSHHPKLKQRDEYHHLETIQQQKSSQNETILIRPENEMISIRRPILIIVPPPVKKQKKKYTIERTQLTIQGKEQTNQIQDNLIVDQEVQLESNHSPLIDRYLNSQEFNIEQAQALQQQQFKGLQGPLYPPKF